MRLPDSTSPDHLQDHVGPSLSPDWLSWELLQLGLSTWHNLMERKSKRMAGCLVQVGQLSGIVLIHVGRPRLLRGVTMGRPRPPWAIVSDLWKNGEIWAQTPRHSFSCYYDYDVTSLPQLPLSDPLYLELWAKPIHFSPKVLFMRLSTGKENEDKMLCSVETLKPPSLSLSLCAFPCMHTVARDRQQMFSSIGFYFLFFGTRPFTELLSLHHSG